jgi:septum formation protein
VAPEVDESPHPKESVPVLVQRLARAKALAVTGPDDIPVLAADTVVTCGGKLLGKPRSKKDAKEMLQLLSGRTHEVVTGVCVRRGDRIYSDLERTSVVFATLSQSEIDWYVGTGEPMDKAGAYHVDGKGALFVTAISGSPSNVAGLPVTLVRRLLQDAGVDLGRA